MNNKLALLALIPMVSFLLVPVVAATSAPTPNVYGVWVYGWVECGSNGGSGLPSGASLHYAGLPTIAVTCIPGQSHEAALNDGYPVFIAGQPHYTATVFAGGHHYTERGTFGINDCGSSLYGKQDAVKAGEEVAYGVFDLNTCIEEG